MPNYLMVDSGTTRTRIRLWSGGQIKGVVEEFAGARDVAIGGSNAPIRAALTRLIGAMRRQHPGPVEAVICSGMITSNVGLYEVPHAIAPVSAADLSRRVVRRDFPDITYLPIYFIPGIKTLGPGSSWEDLAAYDVMRGEEVECFGLLTQLPLAPPLAFFHCGSHHKLIVVDAAGRIVRSSTAITGELLAAISQHTILAGSLVPLDGLALKTTAVEAGIYASASLGLGRALFLVRVGEVIAGRSREAVTSFLLGALAGLDLQLIERELDPATPLVIYGSGAFPAILEQHLKGQGGWQVCTVSKEQSEAAAVVGAVRIVEAHFTYSEVRDGNPNRC